MNRVAVIVAGGTGSRMGKDIPKQFLTINSRAILLHTIDAFLKAYPDIKIVLVLHADYIAYTQNLIEGAHIKHPISYVKGGETRFQSVKNGLQYVDPNSVVFVHDAVRCLVSPELIRNCFEIAAVHGSAIPVIPVRDSLRKWDKQADTSFSVPREQLYIVQTPQTFKAEIILESFTVGDDPQFTDEATVVEAMGYKTHLIEGEGKNIKITFPEDLVFASWVLGGA
jgi:2-C-methyl-D-erythritol 4-phosphate cytidylyltransferase